MNWLPLITVEQLMEVVHLSERNTDKVFLIFKHSTRCSISSMALNRLERSWGISEKSVSTFLLDLLNYRSVSDKIATQFSIQHQSPQVLVIKNGKCIYTASHSDISTPDIEAAINS